MLGLFVGLVLGGSFGFIIRGLMIASSNSERGRENDQDSR